MGETLNHAPLVSVIMTVYNGGEYLSESIESILNQSYPNIEFIIIDDGSTDNSYSMIKKYSKMDSRIKIVKKKKNKGFEGYISNLNLGLNLARGKYIARMDADDVSLPERLKLQVDYLENHRGIFLIGSGRFLINSKGSIIGLRFAVNGSDRIGKILPKRGCIVHSSIMFRNDSFVRYRSKMRYCEDYDLFLNLLSKGKKLDNIFFPLIKYRFKNESISRSNAYAQNEFSKKAVEFFFQRLKQGFDYYSKFDVTSFLTGISKEETEINQIRANFIASNYVLCERLCLKNSYNSFEIWVYLILCRFKPLAYFSKQLIHFFNLIQFYLFY